MIELEHVVKRFGELAAVDDLTLTVERGELFAFLGPNGAGKTTTIKMIVGLLRADEGSVRVCGYDVRTEGVLAKSKIGYIPDQPYLYDRLTGREFLEFVGRMYEMDRTEAGKRIEALGELFEIVGFMDELCANYSHGMRQRVVICSALLHDPEVIVVDEPMVGLDPKGARLMKSVFRERVGRGLTVFMSTHTLAVAEETADRVGIIHKGKVLAVGRVEEIVSLSRSPGAGLEEAFLQLTTGAEDGGIEPASFR